MHVDFIAYFYSESCGGSGVYTLYFCDEPLEYITSKPVRFLSVCMNVSVRHLVLVFIDQVSLI